MANHDAIGREGTPFVHDVERGKIREFARATGSTNTEYLESENPPMPATFLTTQFFWQTPDSNPWKAVEFSPQRGLHAEQEYTFFGPPPQAGTRLTGTSKIANIYEKQGRQGGTMTFVEMITEYRDETGRVVAEAKMTGVETAPKEESS